MAEHWQIPATAGCVIAAAAFVLWRIVRLFRGKTGGCGTGACSDCAGETAQPLVTLDTSLDPPSKS
ncbi:MAG: hypothetical protein ACE5KM_11295 [Planctomycetaceae bacterium]